MIHSACHLHAAAGLPTRRGSAYFAVLGAALVVATIGMGALSLVRVQRLAVRAQADTVQARLLAESGLEMGVQLLAADPNWRTNYPNGTWVSSAALGTGTLTLDGTDPTDGSLANRPTDSLVLKATARQGNARQIVQATLVASGPALDCFSMAVHTAGQLRINSGKTLTVTGAPASTNAEARLDGGGTNIVGDLQCQTLNGSSSLVSGTTTVLAPSKAMPASGVVAMYTALGTVISPGNTMTKAVLTPGYSSYGTPNADGVYVINTSSNLTIKGIRLEGTLVINCPGQTVTIDQSVLMHNYRADYPVLIVDGNLTIQNDSVGTQLSEAAWGVSFNPTGAAYPYPGGTSNATTTETYPNEIQGLVHVRGSVYLQSTARVRGALIGESTANDAVRCNGTNEIVYDSSLVKAPPMGYMKSVSMSVQNGSWRQVVLP